MLVLSRQQNQELVIDLRDVDLSSIPQDQRVIRIGVVSVRGDRCRQSIEAPRLIPVHRGEVFARIEAEKETA